jgi:hypothetical protein
MSATSNWLDFSANSNLSNPTYMTGFLDISYGNVFLRNSNLFIKSADASLGGRLFVAGDMSLSGRLYAPINSIPANAIIGGGGATFTNTTANFASNNSIVTMTLDTSAANTLDVSGFMSVSQAFGVGVTNPQYQVDVGGGQIGCGRMAQFGTGGAPFTPGNNITTNIITGQFTGPLSTTADTSLNGRLFVLGDTSKNGMLFVGADTSLNGRLFVKADASLNGNLTLGGNLVVNGNLSVKQFTQSNIINTITTNVFSVSEDLNLAGRLYVSGDVSFNGGNLRVGVAPTNVNGVAVLDIVDQNNQIFNLTEYNNFDGAVIRGRRALGTAAAPLAVTADTTLTGLRGFGYNGTNLGSTRNVDIGLVAAETYTSTAQGSYIYFGTSATGTTTCSERMRIAPSGNVGIGTTNPTGSTMQIGSAGILRLGPAGNVGNAAAANGAETSRYQIAFSTYRDVVQDQIGAKIAAINYNLYPTGNPSVQSTALAFFVNSDSSRLDGNYPTFSGTNTSGTTYDSSTEAMRISAAGNVGIGTNNPSCALDVGSGTIQTLGTMHTSKVRNSLNQTLYLQNDVTGGDVAIGMAGAINNTSTNFRIYGSDGTTTAKNTFTVLNNGNVGIGPTNPQAALDVTGAIRVSGGITTTYSTLPTFTSGQVGQVITGTSYGLASISSGNTTSTHYVTLSPGVWILFYIMCGINSPGGLAVINLSTTKDLFTASNYSRASTDTAQIINVYVVSTTTTYYANLTQYGSTNLPVGYTFTAVRIA